MTAGKTKIWIGIALLSAGCNSNNDASTDNVSMPDVHESIKSSNEIYFTSFEQNNAEIFAARYAEDACIMVPNAPQACGREAIIGFFHTAYKDYGLRNGKFTTTAIYGNDREFVTEEGLWQSFNEKGELFDDGKFLVLWKKTSKGWKMFRDSFSSNRNNHTKNE